MDEIGTLQKLYQKYEAPPQVCPDKSGSSISFDSCLTAFLALTGMYFTPRYSYLDCQGLTQITKLFLLAGFVICLSFLFLEFLYNKMPPRLLHQRHYFGEVKAVTSEDLKLEEMKQNIMDHVQIMQEKTEKFILNNSHEKNLIADKFYENLMLMKEEFIAMNNMKE